MKEKELVNKMIKEKALPESNIEKKPVPKKGMENKQLPKVGNPENTVLIGDRLIEIKPTKLKYHRNNVAAFYKIVDMLPLTDILQMTDQAFGDGRDGDKALMDWLICVTDDEELIRENYDSMDTETVEKMLSIFKRVNHIDEKEEKQKNAQSRMTEA